MEVDNMRVSYTPTPHPTHLIMEDFMEVDNMRVSLTQLQDADFSVGVMSSTDYLHSILITTGLLCTQPVSGVNTEYFKMAA